VLAGVVCGIPQVAANLTFHFFGGAFDLVLYTAFVEILNLTLPLESSFFVVSEGYKARGMPSPNGCFRRPGIDLAKPRTLAEIARSKAAANGRPVQPQ
jgi:hypothetical protein